MTPPKSRWPIGLTSCHLRLESSTWGPNRGYTAVLVVCFSKLCLLYSKVYACASREAQLANAKDYISRIMQAIKSPASLEEQNPRNPLKPPPRLRTSQGRVFTITGRIKLDSDISRNGRWKRHTFHRNAILRPEEWEVTAGPSPGE